MNDRVTIDLEEVIKYRDATLIPFAERRSQALLALVNSLAAAHDFWADAHYCRACDVTNRFCAYQKAFLERFAIALDNLNKMLYAYMVDYLGYDMEERTFTMDFIPTLNVGSPNTRIDTEPQALYDVAKVIYQYSVHLSEDMDRLNNNHYRMQEHWKGTQYDQFTDIMYEMARAVREYVEALNDISKKVAELAIAMSKAKDIPLDRDIWFDTQLDISHISM